MMLDLLSTVETEAAGAASALTDVLGVGATRMHPHDNKFHTGNGGLGATHLYSSATAGNGLC
jgi:hypothetical protein